VPLHKPPGLFEALVGSPDALAQKLVDEANAGSATPAEWLGDLVRNGFTTTLATEIKRVIADYGITTYPDVNVKTLKVRWVRRLPPAVPERAAYGLALVTVIEAGMLERIGRCDYEKCSKFFVGDPRSRWCSKKCGSNARVRAKRMRDAA
jgi:hypothetical protein